MKRKYCANCPMSKDVGKTFRDCLEHNVTCEIIIACSQHPAKMVDGMLCFDDNIEPYPNG